MVNHRSIQWHTADGVIYEVSVEYEQTFMQWLLRKPATKRTWVQRSRGSWWVKLGQDVMQSISDDDKKEIKMLAMALHSIEFHNQMQAARGW
jgi:hypothetical protein